MKLLAWRGAFLLVPDDLPHEVRILQTRWLIGNVYELTDWEPCPSGSGMRSGGIPPARRTTDVASLYAEEEERATAERIDRVTLGEYARQRGTSREAASKVKTCPRTDSEAVT